MTDIDLLPLPEGESSSFGNYEVHDNEAMIEYARANVVRNTALLRASFKALAEALELCLEMEERPEIIKIVREALAIAKQSASSENPATGEVEYEYEVWQDDALQAGGRENDYASAKSEANHYAMMYAQDGPVEVRIYEKRLLSAAKVQTKRHPYHASGSLSEYGVFPECDA